MIYEAIRDRMPGPLARYVLHFEGAVDSAIRAFASATPAGARILDAGAGEGTHRRYFHQQRYCGLDLGVGDAAWDYSRLDVLGDLENMPFRPGAFEAAISVVTLEHVREPGRVLEEIARVLKPGGRLLLVAPQQWEEHQQPHDYFRFTRYGLQYLLERAGFQEIEAAPVGGIFRLLSRRLLNALQFFPGLWMFAGALFLAPPALLLPLLDSLDQAKNSTLGYICSARKSP